MEVQCQCHGYIYHYLFCKLERTFKPCFKLSVKVYSDKIRQKLVSVTATKWVRDWHVAIGAVNMTFDLNIWCQHSHDLL